MNDSQGQSSAILMALGELKGQTTAIQAILTSYTERMDRQDERMDRQDKKLEEHVQKDHGRVNDRLGVIDKKFAYWSGSAAVIGGILPLILKKLGLN